ncbi:hypothetical protein K435DRAFT_851065 [Dendrothele bispora CBS 962.96]|uniref:Uncharacterized protein n=1 Tax=Dendrothele bispora (strain CBS 962.96) TaxID=1314807 RepID=A0A4S8MMT8_DENBC|nr:hypothetical protein K435DRAFT_851065 [Dendrothele bispora CBS 962.96]
MITSVIGPGLGYSPSSNPGLFYNNDIPGWENRTRNSHWAPSSPSSSASPPYHPTLLTSTSSPSTLDLFFSTLQQRHLLASSIINFEFATGLSDCQRELGYQIQQGIGGIGEKGKGVWLFG